MSNDPQVRREAWVHAREQAALLLDKDLTASEVTDAAVKLAEAFRDLDPGPRELADPVLGPRGLGHVTVAHAVHNDTGFDIVARDWDKHLSEGNRYVAMIPAATLEALVRAVTDQEDGERWIFTLEACVRDLRRIYRTGED